MKNAEAVSELGTDMYRGLSEREAVRRRRRYGANDIWHVKRLSAASAVRESLFDISTLLLIVSAASAALFDKSGTANAVVLILIIGGILRSVVYVRANRILEDMAQDFIPIATVIRDGQMKLISSTEVVPGDILFLEAGSTVPCDGRVLAGDDSVVSERGITENTTPVHKFETVIDTKAQSGEVPCECRSNMLFAGSTVLSGDLRMVATSCGMHSLIGMKQEGIEIEPSGRLPMIERLESFCKLTSLIMLACVMGLTVLSLFFREGFTLPEIFLTTLAMSVAAMSEYLTVIGYIVIAVSVHRCAGIGRDNGKKADGNVSYTRIRKPSELEKIADIGRIVFCGSSFFESGSSELAAYRVNGRYYDHSMEDTDTDGLRELISYAYPAVAAGAAGRSLSSGMTERHGERTHIVETAGKVFSKRYGIHELGQNTPIFDHVDSSNVFAAGLDTSLITEGNSVIAVSCGGIAEVLRVCSVCQTADGTLPLDAELKKRIFTECARLEYIGAKLVAVAKRPSEYTSLNRLAVIIQDMTFLGFFAVAEQAEEGIRESVSYMRENGIIPIILSSDAERDLYYCHDIGFTNKRTKVVPYTELKESDLSDLSTDGMIVSFPDMKYGIPASAKSSVMRLIMSGEREKPTAAVGRDVSDVDVLRAADVGIAAASSVYRPIPEPLSRVAAAVVRPQTETGRGGLSGILRARRIAGQAVSNLGSAAFYMTAAQVARLVVILSAVLLPWVPLLNETSILSWGLLFDFAAVLVMAFEHGVPTDSRTSHFEPGRAVLWGLLWGILPPLLVVLTRLVHLPPLLRVGDGADRTLLVASLLLCGLVMASESMKKGSLFRSVRVNYAFFCFFVMTVLWLLFIMLTKTGASLIGGAVCKGGALLVPAPALIVLAVWEGVKMLYRNRRADR